MERLLVSACLLGVCCKYSGGNNALPADVRRRLSECYELVPVCPEVAGGLPVPRDPAERRGAQVVTAAGRDVTSAYEAGAELALKLAGKFHVRKALLKARSPSCGAGESYDGSFSHTVVPRSGVTAELLQENGLELFTENETDSLLH